MDQTASKDSSAGPSTSSTPQAEELMESSSESSTDRNSPSYKDKRERNKNAVKKHRKKLNEYLEQAPKNIQCMEKIDRELDKSIRETERHIAVLKNLLANHKSW